MSTPCKTIQGVRPYLCLKCFALSLSVHKTNGNPTDIPHCYGCEGPRKRESLNGLRRTKADRIVERVAKNEGRENRSVDSEGPRRENHSGYARQRKLFNLLKQH